MNRYVERYVYDVTRRLNPNLRDDVSKELLANIYDMLPDQPTDEEIQAVLYQLGHPSEIASKYQTKERYLISPAVYDDYIKVMKWSALSLGLMLFAINFVQHLIATQSEPFGVMLSAILTNSIGGFIEGAWAAIVTVTITFIVIDRTVGKSRDTSNWKLTDLPELANDEEQPIQRTGIIFSLVFNTLFVGILIYLLYHHEQFIGWYTINANNQLEIITPLFNDRVLYFIPAFIVSLIVLWAVKLFSLTQSTKNLKVVIADTIENVLTFVIMIALVYARGIINPDFFETANAQVSIPNFQVEQGYEIAIHLIAVTGIVIIGIYLTLMIMKVYKERNPK